MKNINKEKIMNEIITRKNTKVRDLLLNLYELGENKEIIEFISLIEDPNIQQKVLNAFAKKTITNLLEVSRYQETLKAIENINQNIKLLETLKYLNSNDIKDLEILIFKMNKNFEELNQRFETIEIQREFNLEEVIKSKSLTKC